ncbi:MAG: hypothetical protein JSS61_05435 [Verrucomicrobia bacterium]|nr:hypothetical protein [Verrucomicrobiota bacterium]
MSSIGAGATITTTPLDDTATIHITPVDADVGAGGTIRVPTNNGSTFGMDITPAAKPVISLISKHSVQSFSCNATEEERAQFQGFYDALKEKLAPQGREFLVLIDALSATFVDENGTKCAIDLKERMETDPEIRKLMEDAKALADKVHPLAKPVYDPSARGIRRLKNKLASHPRTSRVLKELPTGFGAGKAVFSTPTMPEYAKKRLEHAEKVFSALEVEIIKKKEEHKDKPEELAKWMELERRLSEIDYLALPAVLAKLPENLTTDETVASAEEIAGDVDMYVRGKLDEANNSGRNKYISKKIPLISMFRREEIEHDETYAKDIGGIAIQALPTESRIEAYKDYCDKMKIPMKSDTREDHLVRFFVGADTAEGAMNSLSDGIEGNAEIKAALEASFKVS